MRVEPELPDHPKYDRLKRRVGDYAMEALMRLWGHCQQNQRGGFWKGADAEYVEIVAKWEEQPVLLFRSLVETGWVEVISDGPHGSGVLVHDWEEMNSQIVNNWMNGQKGGRGKKGSGSVRGNPVVNHRDTQRLTSGERTSELGFPAISGADQKNPVVNPIPDSVNHLQTQREPYQRNVTEHNETVLPEAGATVRYDLAGELIEFLNKKTGADFKGTRLELDLAADCLARVGNDVEAVKKMVARQVVLWGREPKTAAWLQPRTLFDPEKFDGYFAMRDLATDVVKVPAERKKELEELIGKHPANRQSVFHRADVSAEERENLKKLREELSELTKKQASSNV